MSEEIYSKILDGLIESSRLFLGDDSFVENEVSEDFLEIVNGCNINNWSSNIDGEVKTVADLLTSLENANKNSNKQQCIESIAMLRSAIADIESAFSNAMDSMESLVVSIRDK